MSDLVIVVACWLGSIVLIMAAMARDLHRGVKAPTRPLRPAFELSVADVAEELGVAFRENS
jgi:hypothetical protein